MTSSLTCAGAAIWMVEAFEGPTSLLGSDPHFAILFQSPMPNPKLWSSASASSDAHASDRDLRCTHEVVLVESAGSVSSVGRNRPMPMNPFLLPLVASITLPLPFPFSPALVEDGPPSFCRG